MGNRTATRQTKVRKVHRNPCRIHPKRCVDSEYVFRKAYSKRQNRLWYRNSELRADPTRQTRYPNSAQSSVPKKPIELVPGTLPYGENETQWLNLFFLVCQNGAIHCYNTSGMSVIFHRSCHFPDNVSYGPHDQGADVRNTLVHLFLRAQEPPTDHSR